jgi:Ca2+-binding EF-hand superfamily protein
MSCVKNCDKEVPELNTRPLGIDFGLPWLLPPVFQNPGNMAVSQVETNYWMGALLTVLQGSVLVHYMPKVLEVFGMDTSIAHATPGFNPPFYAHAAVTVGLMATPGLLSLLLDELAIPLEDLLTRLRYVWGKPLEKDVRRRRVLIQAYETILKLDEPLEEAIHDLDPDGDGLVSCWEFQRLLKNLSLPVTDCQIITESIRQSLGKPTLEALPVETFLDVFQQLYVDAIGSRDGASHLPKKFQVKTKKSSVELFNELDQDGDGFIMPGEFDRLVDREFAINRPWKDKLALFQSADVLGKNRLNLFEFMTLYKKVVRAGIQEIGYGYLPLAWASLTAYWVGISLRELGSTLNRLPDTFYLDRIVSIDLPYWVAEERIITVVQSVLILGSLPFSIGLTQKLCDDNKITGLRFGVHVALQVLGAWATLYFMLATDGLA